MNVFTASPSPEAVSMYNDQDIFTQDMAFSAQLADQDGWSYFKNSTNPSNQHSLYSSRCNSQSRVRKSPPVPVPNLTKKSRGRRVPTISDPDSDGSGSGGVTKTRTFKCSVASCGKCFLRGEHLKRHVRSIHTHDKPFKCTIPSCGKHFSRRDNLFQHLKIHKDQSSAFTTQTPLSTNYSDRDDSPDYQRSSTSPVITAIVRPSFTIPTTPSPRLYSQQPSHYGSDYTTCNRFATDTIFNVSSLRTEPLSSIALDYHYAMSNDATSEYPLMQHSPSYSDSMLISTSHSISDPQFGHGQTIQYFSH